MNKSDFFVLLNIPYDGSINIDDVVYDDVSKTKFISISRNPSPTFCPDCGCIMHSRGKRIRTVAHPVMQDGSKIILKISQRRWKCTGCSNTQNESFPFLARYKRYTLLTPLLILNAMKDLNRTAVSVAKQFNISDTEVHDIFSQYVDLKRLPLPEYISIDEVYLNISDSDLYAFVIMDFVTGEIVDIVHNRWSSTLDYYFSHISKKERKNVKGVISDAYGPYQNLCENFFPNAVQVLDSFHVVKYINERINRYINEVLKKYRKKQQELLKEKNEQTNRDNHSIKDSEEIILLRDYRWIMLKNVDDINYSYYRHYHKSLGLYLDTYQIEKKFFDLDVNFKKLRDLKELYITFNSSSYDDESQINECICKIVKTYKSSGFQMFIDFAEFIEIFKANIIRSFTTVQCKRKSKKEQSDYYARLSNGPMEGFNRKPKDFKRNSRGFSNFDYTRNRILWSSRKSPEILAVPKTLKQIHIYHKKKKKK